MLTPGARAVTNARHERAKTMAKTIEQQADQAADDNGMVAVTATVDNVQDNGKVYNTGDEFHMHKDLIGAHVDTGQVTMGKAKGTPRNKQAAAPVNK